MTADEGETAEAGRAAESGRFTEAEIEAAVAKLSQAEAFAEAEGMVSRTAPGLQRILAGALGSGGWFGESHESELLKAATTPDQDERLTAVRTLLAEEARIGMMVGVAVGWALHDELVGGAEGGGAEPSGSQSGTEADGDDTAPAESTDE